MDQLPIVKWTEEGEERHARWRSESAPPPPRILVADDTMAADTAHRLASEGTALLWRGDFQNARQLMQALARRIDRKPRKPRKMRQPPASLLEAFHLHRQAQAQRARILGSVLIPFEADCSIPLRRAPDVREACVEAWGTPDAPFVASLRELQGLIGAHEWRKKGVEIPALEARIHPHFGVFSPVRGEYVDLVAAAPLPSQASAFDIGAGTGVLSALLAKRGVRRIVATELDPRALACAQDNLTRLGLEGQVKLERADLFPAGRTMLAVCNPPWLPGRPSSAIEQAIYDPDSRMLRGFLDGLQHHLEPKGEGWLILSDFAEHLGLRSRDQLLEWIAQAGLRVVERTDIRPRHGKAADADDPLHAARSAEVTSLWRLAIR
jgi:methylase of polypeptide subunit release factors